MSGEAQAAAAPSGPGLETPSSALVVAAHPDDAEFQCGATLTKWARDGALVHHLVLTDGTKGTWDPDVDPGELLERRQHEQRRAAETLGARGEVVFLGEVDGELCNTIENRARVSEVIRRLRPSVVLGHDPWKRYRLHPDHHAAGRLTVDAIVAARDPFFHREQLDAGLVPHRPDALLLFEPDTVNHLEVVAPADVETKLAALLEHRSQLETTHFYRLGDLEEGRAIEEFRTRQISLLEHGDTPGGSLAETFHVIIDQL